MVEPEKFHPLFLQEEFRVNFPEPASFKEMRLGKA